MNAAATSIHPLLLAGVPIVASLVGGMLAMLGSSMVERRRWLRESALREEQRHLEARQATRLVELELFTAEQLIAEAARSGSYPVTLMPPATSEWDRWRQHLVLHLGVADWHRVTAAYDALASLGRHLEGRAVRDPLPLAVEEGDQLRLRWCAIRLASWILRAQVDEAEKLEHWLSEDKQLTAELFGLS